MGYLRLMLALIVVSWHTVGELGRVTNSNYLQLFTSIGGTGAVETFFTISGFYMAMILERTYRGRPAAFWLNRALRIYPTYLICLSLVLISGHVFGGNDQNIQSFEFWVANVLALSPTLLASELGSILVVAPAWTLAIELPFYILVPFIVRLKTYQLATLASISLATKLFVGISFPTTNDIEYLPLELHFFLLGIILWRFRERIQGASALRNWLVVISVFWLIIASIIRYLSDNFWPPVFSQQIIPTGSAILLGLCIPKLMLVSHQSSKAGRLDAILGGYSYPLYLSHLFVVETALHLRASYAPDLPAHLSFVIILLLAFGVATPLQKVDIFLSTIRARVRNSVS